MQSNKEHHPFYCSDLSRDSHEGLFGTAGISKVWVLLEYPKPWGEKAITDSDLPPEVKAHLGNLAKSEIGIKTLLIRQNYQPKEFITLFIAIAEEQTPLLYKFELRAYEQLLNLDIQSIALTKHSEHGVLLNNSVVLVCTHGKHDKCCAKYGLPTYKAVRKSIQDLAWESSHVGGDRFAPNVVCFPHGLFYGHVDSNDGESILKSYSQKQIYLKNYRGRACYERPAQVAEYFIRTQSGITNLDHLVLQYVKKIDGNTWQAAFHSPVEKTLYEISFEGKESTFQTYLTCSAVESKSVMEFHLKTYQIIQE